MSKTNAVGARMIAYMRGELEINPDKKRNIGIDVQAKVMKQ